MANSLKSIFLKLYKDRRVRFLFVGCLNTLVGAGTTLICYAIMGYGLFEQTDIKAWQNFLATIIGYSIGTVHSYIWNKFFTFQSKDKSLWEFVRFVAVCVVQYGVNFGLTLIAKQFIKIPFVYTALVTVVCMVVSFIGHSLFSFGKRFNKNAKKEKTE